MFTNAVRSIFFLTLAAAALSIPAGAADGPLQNHLESYVVETKDDGEEILREARTVEPGQLIEYRLVYNNVGSQPLSNLVVTGPIPGQTQYVNGSAATEANAKMLASIDGGGSFREPPITRQVEKADGRVVTETVPASEYTDLRWVAGEPVRGFDGQIYSYRVRVQ